MQEIRCGARHLRPGAWLLPRRAMLAFAHRQRHQFVPCRIEGNFVETIAEAIVRVELGSVAVGARGERMGLAAAEHLAPGAEPLVRPARTLTRDGILQRSVGEEEVPSL